MYQVARDDTVSLEELQRQIAESEGSWEAQLGIAAELGTWGGWPIQLGFMGCESLQRIRLEGFIARWEVQPWY